VHVAVEGVEAGCGLCTARVQLPMMKNFLRCFNIQAAAIERLYAFVEAVLHGVRLKNDGNIMGAHSSYKRVVPVLFSTNVLNIFLEIHFQLLVSVLP
jgi:hypothetical protein